MAERICRRLDVPDDALAGCILDVAVSGRAAYAVGAGGFFAGARPSLGAARVLAATADEDDEVEQTTFELWPSDSVAPGEPARGAGRSEAAGTEDVYELEGAPGQVVYLRAADDCELGGFQWEVRRPDSSTIGGLPDVCSDIGRVAFEEGGTYTLHVFGGLDPTVTGDYGFDLVAASLDEVRRATAGDRVSGDIDRPGSVDVYEIEAGAGQVVDIDGDDGCDSDLLWQVQRPDGGLIGGIPDLCNDIGQVTFDDAGTYRIQISGNQDATGD